MWFLSWLRKHTSNRVPRRRTPHRRATASFRPQLEALEGRDVPTTLTVTSPLDDGSAGTLRADILAANSGDTIVFDPTLAVKDITLTSGELVINKSLTIQGPGATQLEIDGGYSTRVFEVDGPTTNVTLSGLDILLGNGQAEPGDLQWTKPYDGDGGCILNFGTLTLSGCSFDYSHASAGGGAIYNKGSLTVSGCSIYYNYAYYGGGIDNESYSTLTVTGCDLEQNSAANGGGGGISNIGDTLTVSNSTLSGNTSNSDGGGIFTTSTTKITDCTLSGNSATYWGGGIRSDATLTVSGCTLSGNTAWLGGGIFTAYALTLSNSTLSGNSAGFEGGGLYAGGTLAVTGGEISNNSAQDGGAIFSSYKTSASLTGVTLSGNTASDGGAIWNDGSMTLSGCTVTGNTATHAGGGIDNAKEGHLSIQSKSKVTGNTASLGADLYTLGSVKISKDSTVGIVGP